MKTQYGMQVDAWGAVVEGRASLASQIEFDVKQKVFLIGPKRMLIRKKKLALDGFFGARQEHVLFIQDLGGGGSATVAFRVARYGNASLELSWRLFEKNVVSESGSCLGQAGLTFFGLVFIGAGILTSLFGYGLCLIIAGIAMLGAGLGWWTFGRRKPSTSTYQQFASRQLAQTVSYVISRALARAGISAREVQVLQRTSVGGLGGMVAANPLDEYRPRF